MYDRNCRETFLRSGPREVAGHALVVRQHEQILLDTSLIREGSGNEEGFAVAISSLSNNQAKKHDDGVHDTREGASCILKILKKSVCISLSRKSLPKRVTKCRQ